MLASRLFSKSALSELITLSYPHKHDVDHIVAHEGHQYLKPFLLHLYIFSLICFRLDGYAYV